MIPTKSSWSLNVIWKLFPLYLFGSDKDSLSATDSILQVVPQTMMAASSSTILCNAGESDLCRDDSTAFLLKLVAIASILLAGAAGVSIPLVGRNRMFLQTDSSLFVTAKAGVILTTGFVHMLAGGTKALNNPWPLAYRSSLALSFLSLGSLPCLLL
ncbi:unnamed protein product [Brassica oleracea var. botrytis]|uniref:Uncharacterized protein n=2 Tax=Brassica TaxID=3705 RepID=A0A3P6CG31_BRAOL|nr:unnamed protein product [Brassica napus]CDY54584.1 BnaCnng27380D [Brassica napus]VDD08781.1 unnamed protein product [Brassica oleracea]